MSERRRYRELGLTLGRVKPGPLNAITDVPGVRVGHCTLRSGDGLLEVGRGPVRTGVTAVVPAHDVFDNRVVGGGFILNGAGELSGLVQVLEWGIIETPILLTNTLAVGTVSDAVVSYMTRRHPTIGAEDDVILPLVGECDDSFVNDIAGRHVRPQHVWRALDEAASGRVAEGSVGAGTGMISFDLNGGIGTSSRVLGEPGGGYTVGVLVNSNVGRLRDLRVDGRPVGASWDKALEAERRRSLYGSIIAVLATDAPLVSHQLNRLCRRVALGFGRVGSYAAHGSGEIVVGFSVANRVPRSRERRTYTMTVLDDRLMNPLYGAAIEATEEAMLNAMCMSGPMVGARNRHIPALPLDALVDVCRRPWP